MVTCLFPVEISWNRPLEALNKWRTVWKHVEQFVFKNPPRPVVSLFIRFVCPLHFVLLLFNSPPARSVREETGYTNVPGSSTQTWHRVYASAAHTLRAFYARRTGFGETARSLSAAVWHADQLPCPPSLLIPSPLFIFPPSLDVNRFGDAEGENIWIEGVNMRCGGDLGVRIHGVCFSATVLV